MMSFLNPLGFLLLGLIPVVVALYLRRVRRKETAVPTLFFWQQALGEVPHRAFLGRLRQWLSLVLHLLILLLLVLALARPEPEGGALQRSSTVIVLDTRARMGAVEKPGGETRFAQALSFARNQIEGAREGVDYAVLSAGAGQRVAAPFSGDPAPLRDALATLELTDAGGDIRPALVLAGELLAARPGTRRLLLLTDAAPLPPLSLPEGVTLERLAFGRPAANTAITRFTTRPEAASPQTAALWLEVTHFGKAPVEGAVEIHLDGQLLDVRAFSLQPGERHSERFPALPASGNAPGHLSARLAPPHRDALPLDDHAQALLPAIPPIRVLLVSEGNWFLEKLLPADPLLRFEYLTPDGFEPAMAAGFDVVIYDQPGPVSLAEINANALYLAPGPLPARGEPLKEPLITEIDRTSPLFRLVEWGNVHLWHALRIPLPEGAAADGWTLDAPLRSFGEPLIITGEKAGRRFVQFAFDPARSDLPLRVAYPLLISNTLQWLAGRDAPGEPPAIVTGHPYPLAQGESALGPDGTRSRGVLLPLRNGLYQLHSGPEGEPEATRTLAANTFDEAESNLYGPADPKATSATSATGLRASLAARPLWQWLMLAAFALLFVEWSLYHRRETE